MSTQEQNTPPEVSINKKVTIWYEELDFTGQWRLNSQCYTGENISVATSRNSELYIICDGHKLLAHINMKHFIRSEFIESHE